MSRLVLGLDTATEAIAVALARWPDAPDAPELLAEADEIAPRASLSRLLPAVRDMLRVRGLEPTDLGLVAVGLGPGSYTGIRIGLAAAKGLAQGLDVPLLGVGTLDAIAWGLAQGTDGLLGVVGDAMRGEVYPALFSLKGGRVTRRGPDEVACPADVAARWAEQVQGPLLLSGDGLAKHGAAFRDALGARAVFAEEHRWLPSGRGVLAAAWARGIGAAAEPGAVLPVYTRLADAEHREPGRTAHVPSSGVAGPSGERD